jgi:hypothetical protein
VQGIVEPMLLACGYACTPQQPHVALPRRMARGAGLGLLLCRLGLRPR